MSNTQKSLSHSPYPSEGTPLARRTLLQWLGAGAMGLALPFAAGKRAGAATSEPATAPPASPVPSVPANAFWTPAGMDVMTAIFTRRSHREFTGKPLPADVLQSIIAAGMNAPSANNSQPWRFVVLAKPESMANIPKIMPLAKYAVKAGAAILLCTSIAPTPGKEVAILSAACCGQNMLLACHALGFAGVWNEVYPNKSFMTAWQQVAKLPDDVMPLSLLIMGEPAGVLPPVNRMNPKLIHQDTW